MKLLRRAAGYIFAVVAGILSLMGMVGLLAYAREFTINPYQEIELYMTAIGVMYIAGFGGGIVIADWKRAVALYLLVTVFLLVLVLVSTVNIFWWLLLPAGSYWLGWVMGFNPPNKTSTV